MRALHAERFFIFSGLRGVPPEKTSKFGLNEYGVQNEKLVASIFKSVLIIDSHWQGFGGILDRFDLINRPKE
jgi:hypothetical protein